MSFNLTCTNSHRIRRPKHPANITARYRKRRTVTEWQSLYRGGSIHWLHGDKAKRHVTAPQSDRVFNTELTENHAVPFSAPCRWQHGCHPGVTLAPRSKTPTHRHPALKGSEIRTVAVLNARISRNFISVRSALSITPIPFR